MEDGNQLHTGLNASGKGKIFCPFHASNGPVVVQPAAQSLY